MNAKPGEPGYVDFTGIAIPVPEPEPEIWYMIKPNQPGCVKIIRFPSKGLFTPRGLERRKNMS